jgi:hypothetical protein
MTSPAGTNGDSVTETTLPAFLPLHLLSHACARTPFEAAAVAAEEQDSSTVCKELRLRRLSLTVPRDLLQ